MIILLIIACVFIYFSFFHQENEGNTNIGGNYEWERVGQYAYLSQSMPRQVKKAVYICHIKYQGRFVKSHLDLLNDENHRFCAVAFMNEQRQVCLTIPINALDLPRNMDIDIEMAIEQELNIDGEVTTHFSTVSKTIYISKDAALAMDWFLPILQIQTKIALGYNHNKQRESWQSEYVKIIKECYKDIILNNQSETDYLRDSLKVLSNKELNLDVIIDEYDRRSLFIYFANKAFFSIVDLMVEKIKNGKVTNIVEASNFVRDVGQLLKANHDAIDSAVQFLCEMNGNGGHNHHKDHHSDKDKAWALGVLGLSDNATQADMKKAYRKKISEMHPDKYQELPESVKQLLEQTAQDINKAKEILGF